MHLYLSGENFLAQVPDIHLVDGHVPGIGVITPDLKPGEAYPSIEPAGWFKVLVLDSVTIDCERRVVHWTSKVNVKAVLETESAGSAGAESGNDHRKRISESMYVGGDFDATKINIDDLFKATQKVISQYEIPDIPDKMVFKNLFSLLHIYVLPNIKLTTDDSEELKKAKAKQEELIDFSDREISHKSTAAEKLADSMRNQRQTNYYPELIKPTKSVRYPAKLLEYLNKGIYADIQYVWHMVEVECENIRALKAEIREAEARKAEAQRQEAMKQGSRKEESMKQEFMKAQALRAQALRAEPLKEEPLKEEPMKEESMKEDPMKEELMKEEPMKEESMKAQPLRDESLKEESMEESTEESMGASMEAMSLKEASMKVESDADSNDSSSDGRDCHQELADMKKRRDDLMKVHEEYIHIRESLHALTKGSSVMDNPPPEIWHKKNQKKKKKEPKIKKSSSKNLNPLHTIYIKMYEQFEELQHEIGTLMLKKIRQVSVREAIGNTLREIELSDESFGVDLDRTGSQRPTDVLRNSQVPKRWQTITEKVANAMTKGGTVTHLFQDFVAHFSIQCQGLITEHDRALKAVPISSDKTEKEEAGLPDPMFRPPNPENSVPVVGPSKGAFCFPQGVIVSQDMYRQSQPNVDSLTASDTHSRESADDYMFVFDQEQDYMTKGKETLFRGIRAHFQEMVEVLLTKLKLSRNSENRKKMWLCYESHFYEAVMPSLVQVCNIAGAGSMKIIQDWLPMLTVQDFIIDTPMFLSLLVPTEIPPTQQESESVSNASVESSIREEDTDTKYESQENGGEFEGSAGVAGYSNGSYIPVIIEERPDVGYTNGSKHDSPPSGAISAWVLRDTDRLRTNPSARERRSHRECSVFDDSATQDQDADDVFPTIQEESPNPHHPNQLDKSDQSEYFSCEDDSHAATDPSPSASHNILRRAANGAKEGVLEQSETYPLHNDDDKDNGARLSEDSMAGPRLQMLPSTIDLSDSSSLCSDSSGGDARPESETNDKLLREAENVLAGVRTMQQEGDAESQDAFPRTVSVSDVSIVPPEARDIEIHTPDSVTVVFDKRRLSNHRRVSRGVSIEQGSDAFDLDRESVRSSRVSNSDLQRHSSMKFHPDAAKRFQPVFECLSRTITATAPLHKLQGFKACLELLADIFKNLHEESGKKCMGVCSDNLLDLTILALCNYDPVLTACLYPQMHIVRETLAPGLEMGSFGYTLTTFEMALSILQEKIKLKQDLAENARAQMELSLNLL